MTSSARGSTLGFAPAVVIGKAQPKPKLAVVEDEKPKVVIAEASFQVSGDSQLVNKNKQEGQPNDKS